MRGGSKREQLVSVGVAWQPKEQRERMSDENENSQPNAITPVVRAFEAHSSGFSKRTLDLSPTETLIFVNNFFAWISAGALKERPSIVDKYIGDEIMVVFSKECCLGRPGLPPTVGKPRSRRRCAADWIATEPVGKETR